MKDTCYVIMPYGGYDEEQRKFYLDVFEQIIKPAAIEAGFSPQNVIREDHTDDAGTIARNIVDHVSSSSVVVADLTGCNANVYYELGLAHVFHKSATVLICEKGSDVRFDLANVRRVEYEASFAGISESKKNIAKEIMNRREGITPVDNTVHELLGALPTHLKEYLEKRDEKQLQVQLDAVTRERDSLKSQLQKMGVRASTEFETRSIRAILTKTKQRMKYAGTSLTEQLRNYVEEDDWDGFLDYLIEAMEHGTPSIDSINSIIEICSNAGNDAILEDVLSASRILYPDHPELMARLALLYARRPGTRLEAMQMANEAVGLRVNSDGQYELLDQSKLGSHNEIARFLDTYLAMENYNELISAARFMMDYVHKQEQEMLQLNIFLALTKIGFLDEAEKMLPEISQMESANASIAISQYYSRKGEFIKEYEFIEKTIIGNPEDLDHAINLAAHILNESLIRTPGGIVKVRKEESRKAAAAILFYVIEHSHEDNMLVHRALTILNRVSNHMKKYIEPVYRYIGNNINQLPYEMTERYPLDYVLEQLEE